MDTYQPDPPRYYALYLCALVLAGLVMMIPLDLIIGSLLAEQVSIEAILVGEGAALIAIAFVGLLNLSSFMQGISLVITDKRIAGPSKWMVKRIQFSSDMLDREKSCRQNRFQALLGYRLIISTTGQKIMFAERAFNKTEIEMILKVLNCAETPIV